MLRKSLAGQVVVFAGRLSSLGRRQAADLATRAGGVVEPTLTPRTTMLVAGAETAGGQDGEGREALATACAVKAQEPGRVRTVSEDEFCALVGRVGPSELRRQFVGWKTIRARYDAVRDDHLRYLEKWGVLRSVIRTPADTFYSFADVAIIKHANSELANGAAFRAVLRALAAERAGQLTLDFRSASAQGPLATVVPLSARPRAEARLARLEREVPPTPAERRFLEGERLESGDLVEMDAAMQAYRDAIALDPSLAAAMVNLGNLHYSLDQLAEAHALYVHAVLVDPSCYEAHFNMGNVHHDLGRLEEAAGCYREALRLSPTFADAHFYLAVTLEKLGRSADARSHWDLYRSLAPEGEWVDLADEFVE